jgi:hypothetical protein
MTQKTNELPSNNIKNTNNNKFNKRTSLILGILAIILSFVIFFFPDTFRIIIAVILLVWGILNLIIAS